MFEFKQEYRFAAEVKVLAPTPEGQVEQQFTGIFRLVPQKEIDAAVAADPSNGDAVMARTVLIGWKDDLVRDKAPVPYSEAARDELIALPFARYGIVRAYFDMVGGVLRLKN